MHIASLTILILTVSSQHFLTFLLNNRMLVFCRIWHSFRPFISRLQEKRIFLCFFFILLYTMRMYINFNLYYSVSMLFQTTYTKSIIRSQNTLYVHKIRYTSGICIYTAIPCNVKYAHVHTYNYDISYQQYI